MSQSITIEQVGDIISSRDLIRGEAQSRREAWAWMKYFENLSSTFFREISIGVLSYYRVNLSAVLRIQCPMSQILELEEVIHRVSGITNYCKINTYISFNSASLTINASSRHVIDFLANDYKNLVAELTQQNKDYLTRDMYQVRRVASGQETPKPVSAPSTTPYAPIGCECGAVKAKAAHALWCPANRSNS
jgi:hypothetical protein